MWQLWQLSVPLLWQLAQSLTRHSKAWKSGFLLCNGNFFAPTETKRVIDVKTNGARLQPQISTSYTNPKYNISVSF